MAFQISPGINITEIDRTGVVNQVISNTSAAFAGNYKWGPVEQITTVSTENELAARFGGPDDSNYLDFFSAANFIGYGARLQVIRTSDSAAKAATVNGSGVASNVFWNDDLLGKYTNYGISAGAGVTGVLCARYPGLLGNSLKISYCDNVSRGVTFVGVTSGAGTDMSILFTVGAGTTNLGWNIATVGMSGGAAFNLDKIAVGDFLKFADSAKQYEVVQKDSNSIDLRVIGLTADALSAIVGQTQATAVWAYAKYLNQTLSTSTVTKVKGYTDDEVALAVIDEDGLFTGERKAVLETYVGSKALNGTNLDGTNSFYARKPANSRYAAWISHPASAQLSTDGLDWGVTLGVVGATANFKTLKANVYASLGGGTDPTPALSDIFRGYDLFKDADNTEANLLLQGGHNNEVAKYIIELAAARKDAIAFVSPSPLTLVKDQTTAVAYDNVIDWRVNTLAADTSYAVIDSGWKYQYDKYNDIYRWIPLNPDIAGLCARTDSTANPWFSPAGYNRGVIRNCVKLAFNPTKTYRDGLYTYQINPVITQAGSGTLLFGDKTALIKPSAFDRLSIRRLFIALEKAVATAAKFQLFEFNDEFSRAQFIGLIEPFLREVQGSKGISEFKIICDESNNTQEVIDKGQFNADIFVKANSTINYIQLNFVASNSQANFSEVGAIATL
jgi:phage tail sheath protein FI